MDRIFASEQIVVQAELPALIKAYSKEVIRYQPNDIILFSRDYFAAMANGTLPTFLGGLEKRKQNDLATGVESKHASAKEDEEYNGVNEQDLSPEMEETLEEAAAEEAYAAYEHDQKLVNIIASQEFADYTQQVFETASTDGKMTAEQLGVAAELMNENPSVTSPFTANDLSSFLAVFDTDSNGTLDADEFLRFSQQLFLFYMSVDYVKKDPEIQRLFARIFEACDTDGGGADGVLVFEEVWNAVNIIKDSLPEAVRFRTDEAAVNAYIEAFEGQVEGGLVFTEFSDMLYALLDL